MEFESGAKRSDCDVPNWDSLPWNTLELVARVMTHGEKSYGQGNWRKGISLRTYLNHAYRHLARANELRNLEHAELDDLCDKCSDDPLLAELLHAAANLLMMIETYELFDYDETVFDGWRIDNTRSGGDK